MPCCESWTPAAAEPQTGKLCVITGANSGLGFENAKEMARLGATVVMACRSIERAEAAKAEILKEVPHGKLEVVPLDLASLESVDAFAAIMTDRNTPIDFLVNNAGIMMLPEYTTTAPQGPQQTPFEMQFACNHLGHFRLTAKLLPLLERAKAPRLVIVSSATARMMSTWTPATTMPDMVLSKATYDANAVYGNTKLAGLLFMHELHRRYPNLFVVCAHPGYTATNLQQHSSYKSMNWMAMSQWKGVLAQLRAALDADAAPATLYGPRAGMWGYPVVSSYYHIDAAKDARLGRALWVRSVQLTGAEFPETFTPGKAGGAFEL